MESQKWITETLVDPQVLLDEGPWRGTDRVIALGLCNYALFAFVCGGHVAHYLSLTSLRYKDSASSAS